MAQPGSDSDAAIAWLRDEFDFDKAVAVGEGYQASVRRAQTPFGELVIKHPQPHGLFRRVVKASVRREFEVYKRLSGIVGVARCHGLLDGQSLILDYIPGASYRDRQYDLANREAFFDAFLETLRAMHAAGVAHGDLKRKDNLVVGPGERPYVIDFGIACIRKPGGGPINRLWFDWFKQMDYNAWLKLKYGAELKNMSPADEKLHRVLWIERFMRGLRRCWRTFSRHMS